MYIWYDGYKWFMKIPDYIAFMESGGSPSENQWLIPGTWNEE